MFKSVKVLIIGIIFAICGAVEANAGDRSGWIICTIGVMLIIAYLPGWQIRFLNVTLLSQALLLGLLAGYCGLRILNGDASVYFHHMEIPGGAYLLGLGSGGISIYGLLAAFGLVKRD